MEKRSKFMAVHKRVIALIVMVMVGCCFASCKAQNSLTDASKSFTDIATAGNIQHNSEELEYFSTYGVGETISIVDLNARLEGQTVGVTAVLQKDYKAMAVKPANQSLVNYTFEKTGKYSLIYTAVGADGANQVLSSYSFTVNVQPYFNFLIKPNYYINTSISVDASCAYNNQTAKAEVKVFDPSGNRINAVGSFNATEVGVHLVQFSSLIAGISYIRTYKINVKGRAESFADYFQIVRGKAEIIENMQSPDFAKKGSGVAIVSDSSETVVRYRNIIDFNTLSKNNNLVKLLPLAENGFEPLTAVYVQLIDAHNPTNMVEYYLYSIYYPNNREKEWTYCYVRYNSKNYARQPDGTISSTYGMISSVHFRGELLKQEHGEGNYYGRAEWLQTQVDYQNKDFYFVGGSYYNVYQWLIAGLNNPYHIGFGNEWAGFTTGEAYLQIKFQSSGGNNGIIISDVAGESMVKGEASNSMPSGIHIEAESKGRLPTAVVGEPYKVPQILYTIDSLDGKISNPNFSIKLQKIIVNPVLVKDVDMVLNGKQEFVPQESGEYRLLYSVTDADGNVSTRYAYLTVASSLETPSVSYPSPNGLSVGETFTVPSLQPIGMSYIVNSHVSIVYNGVEYADRAGEKVFLDRADSIKIEYYYKDYLGRELSGSEVYAVGVSDKAIITILGAVPAYAITGKTVILPSFTAFGADEQARQIIVDGNPISLTERKISVTKQAGQSIDVLYKAGEAERRFSIGVVNGDYLGDRFVATTGSIAVTNTDKYVEMSLNSNTQIDMIHPQVLTSEDLAIEFDALGSYDYFDIILSDYFYPSSTLFMRITEDNGEFLAQLNGEGERVRLSKTGGYSIKYNNDAHTINSLYKMFVRRYADGSSFEGFVSGRVNISFAFSGVKGQTALRVYKVGAVAYESRFDADGNVLVYADYMVPVLVSEGTIFDNDFAFGSTVTVPAVEAWTPLSGMHQAILTVRSPSGVLLVSEANAYNEFSFKLTEYGEYEIMYSVSFLASSSRSFKYTFRVLKDDLPTISLAGTLKEEYKVNSTLTIPAVNVGNIEAENQVIIYLMMPNGTMQQVESGNSVKLEQLGVYRIVVVASDIHSTVSKMWEFLVGVS